MDDLVGLSIKDAKISAKQKGDDIVVVHTSSLKGVQDADRDIVIRQTKVDGQINLVVSAFKTKL